MRAEGRERALSSRRTLRTVGIEEDIQREEGEVGDGRSSRGTPEAAVAGKRSSSRTEAVVDDVEAEHGDEEVHVPEGHRYARRDLADTAALDSATGSAGDMHTMVEEGERNAVVGGHSAEAVGVGGLAEERGRSDTRVLARERAHNDDHRDLEVVHSVAVEAGALWEQKEERREREDRYLQEQRSTLGQASQTKETAVWGQEAGQWPLDSQPGGAVDAIEEGAWAQGARHKSPLPAFASRSCHWHRGQCSQSPVADSSFCQHYLASAPCHGRGLDLFLAGDRHHEYHRGLDPVLKPRCGLGREMYPVRQAQ